MTDLEGQREEGSPAVAARGRTATSLATQRDATAELGLSEGMLKKDVSAGRIAAAVPARQRRPAQYRWCDLLAMARGDGMGRASAKKRRQQCRRNLEAGGFSAEAAQRAVEQKPADFQGAIGDGDEPASGRGSGGRVFTAAQLETLAEAEQLAKSASGTTAKDAGDVAAAVQQVADAVNRRRSLEDEGRRLVDSAEVRRHLEEGLRGLAARAAGLEGDAKAVAGRLGLAEADAVKAAELVRAEVDLLVRDAEEAIARSYEAFKLERLGAKQAKTRLL